MRLLGISGSLRESYNTRLLRAAASLLPPGVELGLWAGLKAVPPYDEGDDVAPAPGADAGTSRRDRLGRRPGDRDPRVQRLGSRPAQECTPLGLPPLPANVLRNKPVDIGASTGMLGAVWAQADLRKVLGAIGARVVDRELLIGPATD